MRVAVVLPTDLLVQRAMPIPTWRALRIVQVLRSKGAEIHMVEWLRWTNTLPAREAKNGIDYCRYTMPVPAGGLLPRGRFFLALTRTVRDALTRIRPDGIVVQDAELLWAAVQAGKALKVPLFYDSQEHWVGMVARERPLEAKLYDLVERLAARRLEHVYTAVEAVAQRFRRLGCPATVLYNSRDAAEIRPYEIPRAEAKRRLGLPPESLVMGFTGSIGAEQGLSSCIEALAMLPPDVHLLVLGGPPEELERVRALARGAGVSARVVPHPPLDPAEAVPVHCAFDVGLLTLVGSGPNFEHRLPYKLFDYMALGIPVVVSDYPELRRVGVQEGGFALPVVPGAAASVREAVQRLRLDDAMRTAMGEKARVAFERTYKGERQKEKLRGSHPFWR